MIKKTSPFLMGCLSILTLLIWGLPSISTAAEWQMPPFQPPGFGFAELSEADDNGHVMLVYREDGGNLTAFYYTNGAYTFSDTLLASPSVAEYFDVAMESSGTALAIFYNTPSNTINTKYFNGSTWITPTPDPLASPLISNGLSIAMNGPGSGVAAWNNNATIQAAFFLDGTWSPITTFGNNSFIHNVDIVYSTNGTAVVTWVSNDFVDRIFLNHFDGTSWHSPQNFQNLIGSQTISMGIDAFGNALIAYLDNNEIKVIRFNAVTSTIYPSRTIGLGNISPSIAVAPNGTAVVVWTNSAGDGMSSQYNGTDWSDPIIFATQVRGSPVVSVDTNGNALVFWQTISNAVLASRLPLGGSWGPVEVVSPSEPQSEFFLSNALSLNGIGFALWNLINEENPLVRASASLLPPLAPPANFRGEICKNHFVSQTDILNILTWTPTSDSRVESYLLRRNGLLIATIPKTGPYIFLDHNRSKNQVYVYTLTAVDAKGVESTSLTVRLKG